MEKLLLDKEIVQVLALDETLDEFEKVDLIFLGEWRWGNSYRLIIKDVAGNYWGIDYNEQVGDNYYSSLDDEADDNGEVILLPVEPREVTTIVYEYRNA